LPLIGEREPARLVEVAARFWTTHAAHRAVLADADARARRPWYVASAAQPCPSSTSCSWSACS
jgi:hypothetical protein